MCQYCTSTDENNVAHIDGQHVLLCDSCMSHQIFMEQCEDCAEWFDEDNIIKPDEDTFLCWSCAIKRGIIYPVCDDCGCHNEGDLVTLNPVNTDKAVTVCEYCARLYYQRDFRGYWWDLREVYSHRLLVASNTSEFYKGPRDLYRLGVFIPSFDRYEARMYWCDHCGRATYSNEMDTVFVPSYPHGYLVETEQCLCSDCLEAVRARWDMDFCEQCSTWHHSDATYSTHNGTVICGQCYENDYFTCEDCGEVFSTGRLVARNGVYVCERCDELSYYDDDSYENDNSETSRIHHYGYDPVWNHHWTVAEDNDPTHLMMGVEDEASHDNSEDREEHSVVIDRELSLEGYESHFYQKCDSSLTNGIELVSMPMTMNYWHEVVYQPLAKYMDKARTLITEGESDGLHIHLSRKGMNMGHRVKFGAFFEMCRSYIEACARRSSDNYAAFVNPYFMNEAQRPRDILEQLVERKGHRMRCVNWLNDRTVEVRVFRSAWNITQYMGSLELCHAIYQYTKRVGWRQMYCLWQDNMLWDSFLTFCADDPRYLDMFDLIAKTHANDDCPADLMVEMHQRLYRDAGYQLAVPAVIEPASFNDELAPLPEEVQVCNF